MANAGLFTPINQGGTHRWGTDKTSNTKTGWGAGGSGNTNTSWGGGESSSGGWGSGGGWGSSGNASYSGGGGWGSSSKNDDATDKTKPTMQKTVDTNPPVQVSLNNAWGSSSTGWGSSGSGWGSSSKNNDTADKIRPTRQKTADTDLWFNPHRITPGVHRAPHGAHQKILQSRLPLGGVHQATVGAHPVMSLARAVVDGVPPARTPTPLIQTLRSRPRRITPGDHQVPHRAHLKALWIPPLPAGAHRGTLGVI